MYKETNKQWFIGNNFIWNSNLNFILWNLGNQETGKFKITTDTKIIHILYLSRIPLSDSSYTKPFNGLIYKMLNFQTGKQIDDAYDKSILVHEK